MNERRDIICKLRLNEEEYKLFQKKSESYQGNTSAMIRDAVAQFNDRKATGKIQTLSELLDFYTKYQQRLSWLGGNFNQSMHQANSLAISGELSPDYFYKVLMPQTKEAMSFLRGLKNELDTIHEHIEGK